jgi:hypothetical protein
LTLLPSRSRAARERWDHRSNPEWRPVRRGSALQAALAGTFLVGRETRLFAECRLPILFQGADPPAALVLHAGGAATRLVDLTLGRFHQLGQMAVERPALTSKWMLPARWSRSPPARAASGPLRGAEPAPRLSSRAWTAAPHADAKSSCRLAMPSHPIFETAAMRHLCKGVVSPVRESVTTWWLAQTEFVVEYDRPTFRWDSSHAYNMRLSRKLVWRSAQDDRGSRTI